MRTKALIGLAALAAGALSVSAQNNNVYSLNVVGYYNVTMKGSAYTLVANQLNNGTNGLDQVLPNAPAGSLVLKFKNNDYVMDVFDGSHWLDNTTGNPSTTTVAPGEGFFFNNADSANFTATFVGEVPQGNNLTVKLPANYALVSSIVPQSVPLTAANGFPQVAGMLYLRYNNAISDYVMFVNDGTQWLDNNTGDPVTVQPAVGEGFFINNPDAANHDWVRNFTVQ